LIRKCALDPDTGRPAGDWELFADTRDLPGGPDGSVVDSEGHLWNARYGGSSVIRFAPDGGVVEQIEVGAKKTTCPCFGGSDLKTLFITSASHNMSEAEHAADPHAGGLFAIELDVAGLPETPIKL
jgi:sugar lactone lactonase YvrE